MVDMVRTTERKLTFWLAGYYDDFTNAKAVPDDSNTMGSTWESIETHAGNPLNGLAPYNPRYKYAWFIRGTGTGGADFNGFSSMSATVQAERYLHNNKVGEWLTFDPEWYNQGQYEGTTHIQYPDSKTNANRQKFDGATGLIGAAYDSADPKEGFLIFCNGYNTQGQYYAFTGNTDSSYGRDTMDWPAKESSGFLDASAGEPDNAPAPTYRIDTHLAGVYTGEVITDSDIISGEDGGATMFIPPIHSPSNSPFLVQEIYNSASSGFIPTLVYQGSLNCKGDNDIFTIRICPLSNTPSTGGKTKLLFGNSNNPIGITSGTSGDSTNGTYAVDYLLTTKPYGAYTNMNLFDPEFIDTNVNDEWDDYEFILDFTNQRYSVSQDGGATGGFISFNAHPDGRDWTPADFYGWELQVEYTVNKATILIDRVGVCRHLNDFPANSQSGIVQDITPIGASMQFDAQVNGESRMSVNITDDENTLKLLEFFNGDSFANWSLLAFRDNIDRPFYRGSLKGMTHTFNAADRKPLITINSTDHFSDLDHQIPLWELGEGGDADSTGIVAYNRQDSQNRISTYYFGASPLEVGNASLGFNEVEDGTGVWEQHVDTRMRLRSAHPIQMYNDEDEFGINNAYEEWDDAITDGFATTDAKFRSLHARWIQDLPKSRWFSHLFGKIKKDPLVSAKLVSPFSRGDTTMTLDCGAHTLANGGHVEIVNTDGSVDSGIITSAVHSEIYTDIQVAWIHVYSTANGTTLLNDNTDDTIDSLSGSYALAVALVPTGTNLHHRVFRITGSQWEIFNREWGFTRLGIEVRKANSSGGNTNYELYSLSNPVNHGLFSFGNMFTGDPYAMSDWRSSVSATSGNNILKYRGAPLKTSRSNWNDITTEDGISQDYVDHVWNNVFNFIAQPSNITSSSGTVLDIPALDRAAEDFARTQTTAHNLNPIWVRRNPARRIDSFVSIGGTGSQVIGAPHIVQDAKGGNAICTLSATNFFQRNHPATIINNPTVNVLDIDDDFKHIYVLWADMRNNGNANADGFFRRDNFGLMKPTSQNYEVSLVFGDQNTDSGKERQEFVDLVAGEDYDLWEMGSDDPITGTKWSAVSGGSNSESDSKYHNWESKAGAFLIIDTSKFFNLNTYSNGGVSGQISAGRREINDYVVETEGFPVLIDNYWKRSTTTSLNISDYRAWTGYHFLTENRTTTLREEVRAGDRAIQLTDSIIPVKNDAWSNIWRMHTSKIVSEEKQEVIHFNTHGKVGSVPLLTLSSVNPISSALTLGSVFISGSTANLAYLRDGHFIKISSSTTTPSIDGTYRLQVFPNCTTGNSNWVGKITLADPTASVVAGTGTVEAEHTYKLNRLMNLGQIQKGTNTPNTWDGSSYSNIAITSAFLTNSSLNLSSDATTNTIQFTGLLAATDWRWFGFQKGMQINLESLTKPSNNGIHTILDMQDSGTGVFDTIVVENITATETYASAITITDYYYNANSADWLINNHPLKGVRVAPNETTYKNTTTGVNAYHEGAVDPVSLDEQTGYTDAVVYENASSIMPMRLMMQMQGFIKNKGSMTFNEHDKFRVAYLDSLTKNWLNQANLFGMPDIGTIPRTDSMNIGQKDAMTSGRAGVITAVAVPPSTPAGTNDILSTSHGLVVGDTIEIISNDVLSSIIVPPYSTQYTITAIPSANEFRITTTNTSAPSNLGMWRKLGSVDTFGSVLDCRNTTIANIYSQVRQVSGVGDTNAVRSVFSYYMSRDSKPAFRPTYSNGFVFNDNNISLSSLNTESSSQASNIRVFYGADGNYVDYPSVSLGAKPRWEIIQAPELSSSDEALVVAKQEFEKIKQAPLAITGTITKLSDNHTLDGANDRMLYNARFGYIADQSRTIPFYKNTSGFAFDKAMYWTSLRGGNLFTGIQNALDGKLGNSAVPASLTAVSPANNYTWYGANSVSYALQVVHIPHGMPKSSNDTAAAGKVKSDGRLRVVIDIAPQTSAQSLNQGNDVDNGTFLFRVHLLDYDFEPSGNSPATGTATVKSQTSVVVDSNGLYEIPVPSTYWTAQTGNERILLSVNYDYLASLVKLRCGGTVSNRRKNAHDWEGATYSAGHNDQSIFPLGVRKFGTAGYWGARAEYYAPRLNITNDLNFTVGTTLNYTNSRLNLTNESLSIKSLNWSITGRESEQLTLNLERDVSRAAKGFASYIVPKVNMGGKQKFGSPLGKPTPPVFNLPKGKGGSNQGKPKQGNRQDKYGDESVGTRRTAALQPSISPPRDNTPDGSVSSSGGNIVIGSSALSTNVNRRIKGAMDLNNSSVLGDSFSILGQKKPAKAPRSTNGDQSIDSFIIPEGGSAVMGSNGFTLTGRGGDGAVNAYSSTKVHLRVPANPQSNSIRIFGRASLPTLSASSEIAVLYATATCVETGDSLVSTVNIEARTDGSAQTVVFAVGNLRGAEIAGNTIELLLEREAGQGLDTATTSALSVHNIQIANDTRSVSGKTQSNEFTNTL